MMDKVSSVTTTILYFFFFLTEDAVMVLASQLLFYFLFKQSKSDLVLRPAVQLLSPTGIFSCASFKLPTLVPKCEANT